MKKKNNGLALHSPDDRLFHVDMCSGSGMLGLGLKLALGGRVRTVCHVERDARSAALIVERMEETYLDSAPVWDDVATCRDPEFIEYVRQFRPLLVSAGYPCQVFSQAGLRLGENDERYLWPYIIDFIRLALPWGVFLENVPGHLSLGFDTVVGDLHEAGYDIATGLFSAAETGASHERKRLFALALRDGSVGDAEGPDAEQSGNRLFERKEGNTTAGAGTPGKSSEILASGSDRRERVVATERKLLTRSSGTLVADSGGAGLEGWFGSGPPDQWDGPETHGSTAKFRDVLYPPRPGDIDAWRRLLAADDSVKPAIRRDAHGVAPGLDGDRLRIAGNGILPVAAALAFTVLAATHIARGNDSD